MLGAIAVGGALGAPARVELGRLLPSGPGGVAGTFVVNVVGSFLLGLGAVVVRERLSSPALLWPLFATGFCGAFTTFSTLAVEVDLRVRSGAVGPALGDAALSVVAGVVAVVGGMTAGRALLGGRSGPGARTPTPRRRSWN